MPRRFIRRHLPSREALSGHHHARHFARFLGEPRLWQLNRRSVAGGVAVGLFTGLIPGPFQMLAAGLAAVMLRVNLPVAVLTTLYTNPFTIVPLYLIAGLIGGSLLPGSLSPQDAPPIDWQHPIDWAWRFAQWTISLGPALGLGLPLLAAGLALAGWIITHLAWRTHSRLAWRRRGRRRAAQARALRPAPPPPVHPPPVAEPGQRVPPVPDRE
jgi:hypothetical protein